MAKQPKLYVCHADGGKNHKRHVFEAASLKVAVCPICNKTDFISKVITHHLIIRDDAGTLTGQNGKKFKVLCGSTDPIHHSKNAPNGCVYTTEPDICNCSACTELWKKLHGETKDENEIDMEE